ncbi:MAG: DUF1328 domain-containing protein [Pseudomonadaceae bacterium]
MTTDHKAAICFHILETTQAGALDATPLHTISKEASGRSPMYNWAITFFIIALSAAVFAFGGFDAQYARAGAILAPLFLLLAGCCAVLGKRNRRREGP